jgi:hypothetical protein
VSEVGAFSHFMTHWRKHQGSTKMSATAAERMRLYRKRRRQGLQYVRIPLHVTEVDRFIRMGLLRKEQRQDPEAVQTAVVSLIYRALEDAT